MAKRVLHMTSNEVDRIRIIEHIQNKKLSNVRGAEQLGLSARQMRRIRRRYREQGAVGLVSKQRGQPSHHRHSEALQAEVLSLIAARYKDFGPTLACEKLVEQHGLKISVESVRQLMIAAGLWRSRRGKKIGIHPQRTRRSQYGELIQIDGSPHDWFEGRGPRCCLLVFIDDATSRIMQLYFAEQESTAAYFATVRAYIQEHGRPLCFYSDRHSIFRVTAAEAESGTGETQFGRAMRELGIDIICAHSPQAKGRVERANGILQDRLVKEMRLQNISDISTANEFLPQFTAYYNDRFQRIPANSLDAHRAELPEPETLSLILCEQYPRKISKNLEVSYDNQIYQIQTERPSYTLRGAPVTVCDDHGQITLLYKSKPLIYKVFDKHNRPTLIVDSKQLTIQKKSVYRPAADHPWHHYTPSKKLAVQAA